MCNALFKYKKQIGGAGPRGVTSLFLINISAGFSKVRIFAADVHFLIFF